MKTLKNNRPVIVGIFIFLGIAILQSPFFSPVACGTQDTTSKVFCVPQTTDDDVFSSKDENVKAFYDYNFINEKI